MAVEEEEEEEEDECARKARNAIRESITSLRRG